MSGVRVEYPSLEWEKDLERPTFAVDFDGEYLGSVSEVGPAVWAVYPRRGTRFGTTYPDVLTAARSLMSPRLDDGTPAPYCGLHAPVTAGECGGCALARLRRHAWRARRAFDAFLQDGVVLPPVLLDLDDGEERLERAQEALVSSLADAAEQSRPVLGASDGGSPGVDGFEGRPDVFDLVRELRDDLGKVEQMQQGFASDVRGLRRDVQRVADAQLQCSCLTGALVGHDSPSVGASGAESRDAFPTTVGAASGEGVLWDHETAPSVGGSGVGAPVAGEASVGAAPGVVAPATPGVPPCGPCATARARRKEEEHLERAAQRQAALLRQGRAIMERAREINSEPSVEVPKQLDDRVETLDDGVGQGVVHADRDRRVADLALELLELLGIHGSSPLCGGPGVASPGVPAAIVAETLGTASGVEESAGARAACPHGSHGASALSETKRATS